MSHLVAPHLPLAPTKIQHLQATQVAGLVHHSGRLVEGQVPQNSKVPIHEVPMPKIPSGLAKAKGGVATHRPMGHVQMEMHSNKGGISHVYIG